MIKFGTSGWRSIMAEDFTFANVRRVVQAIANHLVSQERKGERKEGAMRPVVVGYDSRFLSPEFAKTAADLLAANGFSVLLADDFVPTPVVSFQVMHQKACGSINFTASHNPADYNGIKFNMANGAPASPEVTHEIERMANDPHLKVIGTESRSDGGSGQSSDSSASRKSSVPPIRMFDAHPAYFRQLRKVVDVAALKKAKLRVGADVLYGTGRGYLDRFLQEAGCRVTVLHDRRDVLFGGHSPEPAEEQLSELVKTMRREKLVAGFGTDGDADRFGVMDSDGTLLSPNEILPIVLQHLVEHRGMKGLVVRSVMTSHFIDAVAQHYGLEMKETPVGFKYIAEAMMAGGFLMGGEESGGMTINGHVPEKDGILACLLMAEVRAVRKKSFRDILKNLRQQVGPYYSDRVNLHLADEVMQAVRRRMETFTPNTIGPLAVKKIVRLDGYKFIFEDDSWLGVRLSGTEPVVRLYLEASSPKKLKQLRDIGTHLIQG